MEEEQGVVQKIGAQYIAKRVADQLLNPTPAPATETTAAPAQASAPAAAPARSQGPEVLAVADETGRTIGSAYRVTDVAVYIVANPNLDRAAELEHSFSDPETQIYFHHENGRLAGIIYAPARSRTLGNLQGGRADDV
jgi:hypothetical protein